MSGKYRYLLYGGAIRGGKSYVSIGLAIMFAFWFPGSRWAIVRKDLPTLKKTTLPTYEKIAPAGFCGPIHKTDWVVKCANGSELIFFPASEQEDPELNRWRGLEVNGFFIEEINEIREATFNKAIERAGSWKCPDGKPNPPPLIVATCNPTKNWVKRKWYDPWRNGTLAAPWFYLPAKITDNPHLDPAYLESLKQMPAEAYRTFVEGSWDTADEPNQLIPYDWVAKAFARVPILGRPRLGVDVARFGDDHTVLALILGRHLDQIKAHHGIDTVQTAGMALVFAADHKLRGSDILVDTIGVGGGVADILFRQHSIQVQEFIAGSKPTGTVKFMEGGKFANRRSEAWWHLREQLKAGAISFNPGLPDEIKSLLIEDLTAPTYEIKSDRMLAVESKDDTKERIGRSTDYGDAVMQAYAPDSADWLRRINTR
jgi:hypothetical protein